MTDPTQTYTSRSSFVASHRKRKCSKRASIWQMSLKPCSTSLAAVSLSTNLGVHADLLKRPIIAHSLEPSGCEAFRRYFWHTLSLNNNQQQGDYSLLSPCLSEHGSGWQEMDVSNRWAVPFRIGRRSVLNKKSHNFYDSQLGHTSVHWQTKVGTDTTWPISQVRLALADGCKTLHMTQCRWLLRGDSGDIFTL